MQVRGGRVLAYQRQASGEPSAQVQWQGAEDSVKARPADSVAPAAGGACGGDANLKHVLGLRLAAQGRWSTQDAPLADHAGQLLTQGWLRASQSARHWHMLELPRSAARPPVAAGSSAMYQQLLSAGPPSVMPAWVASLSLELLPALAPAGIRWIWQDSPSPRLRLGLAVRSSDGGALLFEAASELALQAQTSAWEAPRLAPAMQAQITRTVNQWSQALSERLACQSVKVQVLQTQADRVQVDQGQLAGLRVGDEWLISDRQRVPQRVLEPGAAASLVLAKVERVEAQRADLRVLAGPRDQVRPQWQAWPVLSP